MEYERERKKEWFSLPPQGGRRVICSPTGKTSRLGKFLLPKPEVSSAVSTLPPDWTGVPTGRPEFSPDWIPMHKIGLAQTDTRVSTPDWIMRAGTSSVATEIALYIYPFDIYQKILAAADWFRWWYDTAGFHTSFAEPPQNIVLSKELNFYKVLNSDWDETNFVGKITKNRTPTKTNFVRNYKRIFFTWF
jgi:hypothetical protein